MRFEKLKAAEASLAMVAGSEERVDPEGISSAGDPRENTFVFIKNKKFLAKFMQVVTQADSLPRGLGAVADRKLVDSGELRALTELVSWTAAVDNVDAAMCSLSKPFYDEKFKNLNFHLDGRQTGNAEIHPDAEIAQNVFVGEGSVIEKNVVIMPGCVVMPKVRVGEDSVLFPNVTLYPYVKIGRRCRIHSHAALGADGFGYNFLEGGHKKIWHFGGVEIGDDVEIGANSCVDAGSFSPTWVGDGTKIDNFVQVAHNNKIGRHCVLCGRAGLAGSVTLEDGVVIGAGGGCAPGAILKKGVQLAAMGVVSENAVWEAGQVLGGHPARPLKEWLKRQAKLNILAGKK